ncbi:hypothetical protein AVEN_23105-1 [Araneus ventricosus]|uniref:Uncharacterized protein n=1 Tax=Araneus ventricosus TaxID=182803 RepID=A0A4Y2IMH0_ARAVE|nr:hypothetical protein AVEN_23105-1 [Araneus ventricosus]
MWSEDEDVSELTPIRTPSEVRLSINVCNVHQPSTRSGSSPVSNPGTSSKAEILPPGYNCLLEGHIGSAGVCGI